MTNSFSIRRKKDEVYDTNVEEIEKVDKNDIKSKLYEKNTILNKLDFNVELLNKHFVKCIEIYLKCRYFLDISFSDKYLSENCKNKLIIDIDRDKQYIENKDINIELKSINIISQDMQSVNYISDLIMNIEVDVSYSQQNIYTDAYVKIKEYFEQEIWFKCNDKGWILEDFKPRKITLHEESEPIYI